MVVLNTIYVTPIGYMCTCGDVVKSREELGTAIQLAENHANNYHLFTNKLTLLAVPFERQEVEIVNYQEMFNKGVINARAKQDHHSWPSGLRGW